MRCTGKREREIVIGSVDEILNPAWAPDGHAIAFTAMRQGFTHLCLYDLRQEKLRQLTHDAYADMHPAWSPDSRRIVFVTDRFSTDLDSLRTGPLQLAIADEDTGRIEHVSAFSTAKHINPHWSPDGKWLYFISDPDGIPNVYRRALAGGPIERITAVGTGVSGITASSPALSVSGDGRLAIGVYEGEEYNIYLRDAPDTAEPAGESAANAARLPPGDANGGLLADLLAQPDRGLPASPAYQTTPYKTRMSLAGLGQTTAGIGVNFGATTGGGVVVTLSDMLGDHLLATAVQMSSGSLNVFSSNDLAFETEYFNQAHRWNWGVLGSQVPYVTSTLERATAVSATGESLAVVRHIAYHATQRSAAGILTYPFNRARRVEFQGGFSQTSIEAIPGPTTYSAAIGNVVPDTMATMTLAPRLNLASTSVALVFDTASFGPTGPIEGERYRVEVTPTLGSVNFTGLLVDYRRYIMPVSFYTIAARVVHYGRYGPGADDPRLYPLYITSPGFVRGYDSFDYSTPCTAVHAGDCLPNDRYAGSRMLLGNLELRFPMLQPFPLSHGLYGPLPIELALFADSGIAWTGREKPAIVGGSRQGITSAGLAVRMRVGFMVAEVDVTRPLQRRDQGMVFGFNLSPGW